MDRLAAMAHLTRFLPALAFVVAITAGCNGKLINLGNGLDGGGSCTSPTPANADEVLWIGDSWILVPGTQRTRVRDLAREAQTIGMTEDYINGGQPATTMAQIAGQYDAREAGATKVKVLLADGGTWDTITNNGSSASVMAAANAFGQLLTKVASDGTVRHVIYFLMPEMTNIPGVAALRPLVRQACVDSAVPCHFLDLQPLWAGHPEYTAGADSIPIPTEAGATVIADAIWALMQQHCIAQ